MTESSAMKELKQEINCRLSLSEKFSIINFFIIEEIKLLNNSTNVKQE